MALATLQAELKRKINLEKKNLDPKKLFDIIINSI